MERRDILKKNTSEKLENYTVATLGSTHQQSLIKLLYFPFNISAKIGLSLLHYGPITKWEDQPPTT